MKVLVAMDSFKGSLSSLEAGSAVAEGFKRADGNIGVTVRPLADGGDGTVDALIEGMGGVRRDIVVSGPLGRSVKSSYGIIKESMTAVLEMSSAAGITLIGKTDLNPLVTTTYGVGEIIEDALNNGCRRFIVGIGGSATNDAGAGMLQALGYGLLNEKGNQIPRGAEGLQYLASIRDDSVNPLLKDCVFMVACDVTNPLIGPNGCSAVYGPQKGADEAMINAMDSWLKTYAGRVREKYPDADPDLPGAGAAGGLGFAFQAFLHSYLRSGIEIILDETGLEAYIKECDLVVTGEGMLDKQTAMGKAPIGVAYLAKKYGKRVIAFAGAVTKDACECNKRGIDAFFPIVRDITSREEAMDKVNAKENLSAAAEQFMRLLVVK